ncbi:hypothetical protein PYCCODRAFT_544621 [Trametes coccinea BRFM310]|uniref:Uncharacterized protein n=1 Tax=Trametes coccinea (strain BRFM310) TaxID=1353009 RepID=A0A1Y2ILL0_TRAC3|nr:hypothetical protein PYCCODRAFT_544621 [Trametes coccinea BRFM310]
MFAFSSAVVLASTLTALTASASAARALAPRASPSPGQTYFRPAYTCASSIVQFGETAALSTSDYRTDSATLDCEYGDFGNSCAYTTTTGALLVPSMTDIGCPATLTATSGCIYECALVETGGTNLLEALYIADGNELQCEYWTGNQWLFCLYNGSGALQGSSGESTGHGCPQTTSYQCDASTRRGYRGEDNYTALLARRAARRAREAGSSSPAAPAPAAGPMVRRRYAAKRA